MTCSRSKGLALVSAFLLQLSSFAFAAPLSGTKSVGPTGDYASLTAAIADVNAVGNGLGGALILELQSNYVSSVESFPLTIPALTGSSATNTLTIRPASNATGLSISSGDTTAATVDLNGANHVTFDGRPGGVGSNAGSGVGTASQLIIANIFAGVALRFINEASGNTIRYTTLRASNPISNSGVVVFSTTTGANGNDNNTLDHCDIRDGASTPANGIYSAGTTTLTASNNSGNTVSNCNIYNFYTASNVAAGVRLYRGNDAWTISGNSFYQTASRAAVRFEVYPVLIDNNSGNNFIVTNNSIGGSAPNCGGTAWTTPGTAAAYLFRGIYLSVGTTTPSSVQGNTIANIVWTTLNTTPTDLLGVWSGIFVGAGSVNVGTVTGNTIGSSMGTNSISVTTAGTGGTTYGISSISSGTVAITNNTIGAITVNGSSTSVSNSLVGIQVTAGANTISNNLVGSTATPSPLTGNSLSLNASTLSTSTTGQQVTGILSSSATGANITGNTVANLNNNYNGTSTAGQIRGIATSNGVNTITGNTVRNLTSTSQNVNNDTAQSVYGIIDTATMAGQTVSQNTVHSLANTAASAGVAVTGIYFSGPSSGTNLIARNFVHSLALDSINISSVVNGMQFSAATFTAQNNLVRLGIKADGTSTVGASGINGIVDLSTTAGRNFYHNTVYVGGTQTSVSSISQAFLSNGANNARTYQNNIFVNARSNSGGTGRHYAVRYGNTIFNPNGLTAGGNLFLASGNGGILGANGNDRSTLTAWQAATGQDASSFNVDPLFVNPTGDASTVDLHLQPSSPANNGGELTTGVLDDFDGAFRAIGPPDIGADEFYSNNATLTALTLNGVTLSPTFDSNATTYSTFVPNSTTSTTVTATPADVNVLAQIKINGSNFAFPPAIPLSVGSNTITVLVTAYDGTTTKTYTVFITRKSIFQEWAASNTVANDPNVFGSNGLKNLLNFAFSMNPRTGYSGALVYNGTFAGSGTIASTGQPWVIIDPATNGTDIRGLFVRRKDAAAAGLTYTPQFSADLITWQDSASTPTLLADDGVNQIVSVPYPSLIGGQQAKFFRINVTLAP